LQFKEPENWSSEEIVARDDRGGGDEGGAERAAEMAAPRHVLLDRHDRAEPEHPADVAGADNKHQQHQCPAATDAIEPVIEAEPPGAAPRARPLPALGDKSERRAAFIEAAVFEAAELEEAGEGKDRRSDGPAVQHEPVRLPHAGMEGGVEEMRSLYDVYDKLFWGNNLPAMTPPGERFVPTWSAEELEALAALLSAGFAMLSSSMQNAP